MSVRRSTGNRVLASNTAVIAGPLVLSSFGFLSNSTSVIGFIQIALIIIIRLLSSRNKPRVAVPVVETAQIIDPAPVISKGKRKTRKVTVEAPPSIYPAVLLDTTLYNFLSITTPNVLSLLPPPVANPSIKIPSSSSLQNWTSLLDTPTIQVLQHPTTKTLYAICATYPDVSLRKLFETLTTVEKRLEWDSMCCGSEQIEEFEVGGRRGSTSWLGMTGVGPLKAKDMVLLSVVGQLPVSSTNETEDAHPLRLFAATTSFVHPSKPVNPKYNRMELGVSGFLAESVGEGSKVTQITDLSGLGSWVPSSIVRVVTQKMIPKSLVQLGKTAAAWDIATSSRAPIEGDEWMPPILGTSDDTIVAPAAGAEDEGEDEDDEGEDEDDEVEAPGIISNDIASLLSQLRTLTSRLASLEGKTTVAPATTVAAPKSWYSSIGAELATTQGVSLLASAGGAVGAATIIAIMAVVGRGRR